jgi:hypothetical protein
MVISINKVTLPLLMKFNEVLIEHDLHNEEMNKASQIRMYHFVRDAVKGFLDGIDATIFA